MDQNQKVTQQPPVPQTPVTKKKISVTGIIISLLFVTACIITALAFFAPKPELQSELVKQSKQFGDVTPVTPTTPPKEAPWIPYSDQHNGYIFYYPQTWKLDQDKTNPEKFVLREGDGNTGEIQGAFLTQEQFSKEATLTCQPTQQKLCFIIDKAASSSAYVFPIIDSVTHEVSSATAYITRPDGTGFFLKITKPTTTTYNVFLDLIGTLKFSNEKRISLLFICPDSRSADRKTITYRGVTFEASEVDEKWIQENCK